jgi:SAM-dependent methyltransferase
LAQNTPGVSEIKRGVAQAKGAILEALNGRAPDAAAMVPDQPEPAADHLSYADLSYAGLIACVAPPTEAPPAIPLRSQICRQGDFALDAYRYWCAAIHEVPRLHRKQWEFFYICQVLHERGLLHPGRSGLGFGVGQEPLSSVFAARGVAVVASDQAVESAQQGGWQQGSQHAAALETLIRPEICDPVIFRQRVRFQSVDMNDIPRDLTAFDFCWSACCFEHLGSLEHGLRFVRESIGTLRPGGVAVHTTEFNLSSDDDTVESPTLSIYRRQDIIRLARSLEAAGHTVEPLDWAPGTGFADDYVDLPPYRLEPHVKLRLAAFDCTSIGLIITRGV